MGNSWKRIIVAHAFGGFGGLLGASRQFSQSVLTIRLAGGAREPFMRDSSWTGSSAVSELSGQYGYAFSTPSLTIINKRRPRSSEVEIR